MGTLARFLTPPSGHRRPQRFTVPVMCGLLFALAAGGGMQTSTPTGRGQGPGVWVVDLGDLLGVAAAVARAVGAW